MTLPKFKSTTTLEQTTISDINTFVACHRKYYYSVVRGMKAKSLEIPFLIGGCYHVGIEAFYKGYSLKEIMAFLEQEFEDNVGSAFIRPEDVPTLDLARAVIFGMVKGYVKAHAKEANAWKIEYVEQKCSFFVPDLDLRFMGTIDLLYRKKNKPGLYLGEHKSVSGKLFCDQYIALMPMNKQIQCYPKFVEKCLGERLAGMTYNAAIKPTIRQKKQESFNQFVDRLVSQYVGDTEKFFVRHTLKFNPRHVEKTFRDMMLIAEEMKMYYECLSKDEILNESSWYKNTANCFAYFRKCEFFNICRYGESPQTTITLQPKENRYEDTSSIAYEVKAGKKKSARVQHHSGDRKRSTKS